MYTPLHTYFEAHELPIGLLQAILFKDINSKYFEDYPYMSLLVTTNANRSFNDTDVQFSFDITMLTGVNSALKDELRQELTKELKTELQSELQSELNDLNSHSTYLIGLDTLKNNARFPSATLATVKVVGGKQRNQRGGSEFLKTILCYKRKSNIIAPAPSNPVTEFSSIQPEIQHEIHVTPPQTTATKHTVTIDGTIPVVVTHKEYESIIANALDTFKLTNVELKDVDDAGKGKKKVAIVTFTATEAILKMLDEKCVELWDSYTKEDRDKIIKQVPDKSSEEINAEIQEHLFKEVYKIHEIPPAYHTLLLRRQIALNYLAIADPGKESQTPHFKIKDYYRLTISEAEFKDSDFRMTIEILFALLEHGHALRPTSRALEDNQVGCAARKILETIVNGTHEISKVFTENATVQHRLTSFPGIEKKIVFYMDEPLLLGVEKALEKSWFFLWAQVPYYIIENQPYFLTLVRDSGGVNQLHTTRSLFPKSLDWSNNLIVMYDVNYAEVFTKQERTPLIRYKGVTTYLRPIYRGGHNHFRISLIDDRMKVGHRITSKHFELLNTTLKECFTAEKTKAPRFGGIIRPFNGVMSDGGSRLKSRSRSIRNNVTKVIIS